MMSFPAFFALGLPSPTPSQLPSAIPSQNPSQLPSESPSQNPSQRPSARPSISLSNEPSYLPSSLPSINAPHPSLNILQELYDATGGTTTWHANNWFLADVALCDFDGIECDVDRQVITHIDLPSMGLSGTLPAIIGQLSGLEYLDLGYNHGLGGTIPTELGMLANLKGLDLSFIDNLSGAIPSEIGMMTSLLYFFIGPAEIDGLIPTEIGKLSSLTDLWIYDNWVSGS